MIEVLVEVKSADASFEMVSRADSIQQDVESAQKGYRGCEVRLILPMDPETFFVHSVRNAVEEPTGHELAIGA